MLKLLGKILVFLVISVTLIACTTPSKQLDSIQKADDYKDLLSNAEALLKEGKIGEAKSLLYNLVQRIPQGWKAKSEDESSVFIAYWDMEHFILCSAQDSKINTNKSIYWVQPSYSKAYYLLAYISIESGNVNEANEYIDKALVVEPDHPLLLDEKGLILQHMNAHKDAVQYFNKVINSTGCVTNYEKARALRGKGVSLIDLGKFDDAEQALNESLHIDPDNKVALNELRYILLIRSGAVPPHAPIEIYKGQRKD